MFRFIHSSDLHLGKRFGNFSGDLPGRLREARHAVIGKLADHARVHDASTVLLAGDTFDTETPAPDVRRQAALASLPSKSRSALKGCTVENAETRRLVSTIHRPQAKIVAALAIVVLRGHPEPARI